MNGVFVPLPSANARVEERRGESIRPGDLEICRPTGCSKRDRASKYSTISETGYTDQSRSFFYPKPRAVLTWTPNKNTQLRLRYERVLGQLDFINFVASSNLAASGVNAGNPDLKPDQPSQYEFSFERHFWDKGALVVNAAARGDFGRRRLHSGDRLLGHVRRAGKHRRRQRQSDRLSN